MSLAAGLAAALLLTLAAGYAALIGVVAVGVRRVLRVEAVRDGDGATDGADASAPSGDGLRAVSGDGLRVASGDGADGWPFVSVVVPARDEAAHVGACLRALLAQDYPGRAEVIVVDDFSRDGTPDAVRRLQRAAAPAALAVAPADGTPTDALAATPALGDADDADDAPLRLLQMADVADEASGHKRHALEHGLAAARGDVLLTTDADCVVRPGWLRAMVRPLRADPAVDFVSGPVRYRPGASLFGRMQALEFLGMIAFGMGTLGVGWATICNSANVAYRRRAYDWFRRHPGRVDGAASDEVMLQLLAREAPGRVALTAARAAVVETAPAPDLGAFLAQRQRWASMGTRYPCRRHVAALGLTWAFHAVLLVACCALPFAPGLAPAVLAGFLAKAVPEGVVLTAAARHFGLARLLPLMPVVQLAHVPYLVYIGAAGMLGTVHWKGRAVP
jgi:cellulose synthase/poly-beta-1,6-N-acetylglucosamine synthase-like glycosyltransferase